MSYRTLMVNLELGRSNEGVLRVAADLAGRFKADVIGIATCQPMQVDFGDSYVSGELFEQDREEIRKHSEAAEAEFRRAFAAAPATLSWRSETTFAALADYLAREARSADLIITSLAPSESAATRRVDIGDLLMHAGRPVLIVPPAVDRLQLKRVIVAWKDTRETRRSVFDALPLLKMATGIQVVEIAAEDELPEASARVDDVVGWLARHGISAQAQAALTSGDDTGQLKQINAQQQADLIVAGAYGHSRMREWVFGGVTDDLLLRGSCCALVSH